MATSTSSRSADQAARAGRSASELPGNRRAPRARAWRQRKCRTLPNSDDRSVPQPPQRCASESKRILCQCCRISDLLSMTPYLALARSAPAPSPPPRPGEADVSIDRLSSIVGPEPESANNNFR